VFKWGSLPQIWLNICEISHMKCPFLIFIWLCIAPEPSKFCLNLRNFSVSVFVIITRSGAFVLVFFSVGLVNLQIGDDFHPDDQCFHKFYLFYYTKMNLYSIWLLNNGMGHDASPVLLTDKSAPLILYLTKNPCRQWLGGGGRILISNSFISTSWIPQNRLRTVLQGGGQAGMGRGDGR
jgi:hypothetical protein